MFTYSSFASNTAIAPQSSDYKVFVNGQEIPVYACRISAYPFNRWWPNHQRQQNQSEVVSFVNLIADQEIDVTVLPQTKTDFSRVMIKPYSKGVTPTKDGGAISFSLKQHGGYALCLDDYHGMLYVFFGKPVPCENPAAVTHYFGAGVHHAGKIELHDNESVYLEKDAFVYGCLYAENAQNVHVYGNGVFCDSQEERAEKSCYEPSTNGNVKFYDCNHIKLQGVGFMDSAIWSINLFHCLDVEIDAINVFGQWRYNTDGIDIVNCKRVTIKNSFVHSFDDSITIKGIDKYAFEDNTDMLFENCALWCDWGKTCEIGLETTCMEYKNITFRDCDVLRGGNTACDIQNGDCTEVHHITFENIRLELESFYTPEVLQESDDHVYTATDQRTETRLFSCSNRRYRGIGIYVGAMKNETAVLDEARKPGHPLYAGVHDVLVKDVTIYADERIMAGDGTKCAILYLRNDVEGSEYQNLVVENVTLNGRRLSKDDMKLVFPDTDGSALLVR